MAWGHKTLAFIGLALAFAMKGRTTEAAALMFIILIVNLLTQSPKTQQTDSRTVLQEGQSSAEQDKPLSLSEQFQMRKQAMYADNRKKFLAKYGPTSTPTQTPSAAQN
eukprot:m.358318 g.358318  ORF g.358318 m.358318 type:complete len:108 (+) comp18113_c0_seq1:1255-1578(+)